MDSKPVAEALANAKTDLASMACGVISSYKCGFDDEPTQEGFTRVENKFSLVFVPSIDMHLPGQVGTSSGLWFDIIAGNNLMKCKARRDPRLL